MTGQVVHPQHWPQGLDYVGKRVVVIGSGATAISLIPSLTQKAARVTMLQRSPTYLFSSPKINRVANALRKVLPARVAHAIIRWRYAFFYFYTYQLARKMPGLVKRVLRRTAIRNLPEGYDVDVHFKPPTTRGISDCV